MTTIAYDGRYVAADSMVSAGGIRVGFTEKIRIRNGTVYACAGSAVLFEPMIAWHQAGCDADKRPVADGDAASTALFVFRDGKGVIYRPNAPYPEELFAPDAWGAGAEIAIGALDAGASAERAIEIAISRSVHTGGTVQVVDLLDVDPREDMLDAMRPAAEPWSQETYAECMRIGTEMELLKKRGIVEQAKRCEHPQSEHVSLLDDSIACSVCGMELFGPRVTHPKEITENGHAEIIG